MSKPSKAFGDIGKSVAEASTDIICYLDRDLRITYCNPAWDRFATANAGERAVGSQVVGRQLLDFVPIEVRPFFQTVFETCAGDEGHFSFDYECSSAGTFRLFRMTILPRPRHMGFAVIHSLRVDTPHRRNVLPPAAEYLGPEQQVTLCFHCRRTRRADDPSRWEWVPAHLGEQELRINNSVCPPCRSYFYGLADNAIRPSSLLSPRS